MQGYFNFQDSEGKVSNLKDMLAYLQTEAGMKDYAEKKGLTEDQARKKIGNDVDNLLKKSLVNNYFSRTGRHSFNESTGEYEATGIISKTIEKPLDKIEVDEFQGLYISASNELDKNPKSFVGSNYQLKTGTIKGVEIITREGSEGSARTVNKIKIYPVRLSGEKEVNMDPLIIDLNNPTQRKSFLVNTFGKISTDLKDSLLKEGAQATGSLDNIGI